MHTFMKIQVLAPSSCVDVAPIRLAQQHLHDFGITVELSEHLFAQHRYLAGTPKQRIHDLFTACCDINIDALWCGRGGTGAAQLLPLLDTWLLNKPLIGYSDSTALLNYIVMQGGQALHAPVFQEIAVKNLNPLSEISIDAQEVLALLSPIHHLPQHYPVIACSPITTIIQGKILGGNLTTLCSLQGTPWALQLSQPSILLLEDVGEPFYRLERSLVQLLQSIDLTQLKAVVFGDFYQCPQKNVPHALMDIFAEHLTALNIPMLKADWFGHGEQNRPFWLGAMGEIDTQNLKITR